MSYKSKISSKVVLNPLREVGCGCGATCTNACVHGCGMSCKSTCANACGNTCSQICEVGGGMSRIVPEGKLE